MLIRGAIGREFAVDVGGTEIGRGEWLAAAGTFRVCTGRADCVATVADLWRPRLELRWGSVCTERIGLPPGL